MEEKELKTSLWQRIVIAAVAVVLLGATIAAYAAIIINGSSSTSISEGIGNERIAYYEDGYYSKLAEFQEVAAGDFATFWQYKDAISAYDEAAANAGGVVTEDLLRGTGEKLAEGDTDYLAYYVGWCADATVFDSSLDSATEATAFVKALDASQGMIDGWNTGVVGMRLGGVRVMTLPGDQAYGDQMELCGGYNKPLKFMVMAVAKEEPLSTIAAELDLAYMKLYYAYYGIDYEKQYN